MLITVSAELRFLLMALAILLVAPTAVLPPLIALLAYVPRMAIPALDRGQTHALSSLSPCPLPDLSAAALARRRASPPVALVSDADSMSQLLHNGQAAFAASATATVFLHPLDTLKSRLQSDNYVVARTNPVRLVRRRLRASADALPQDAASPADVTPDPRQRLFTGLYSGLGANVLKEAPDAAIYLAICEQLSHTLVTNTWFASHLGFTFFVTGAIGDAVGTIVRLPAEVACKRLQTGSSTSIPGALADVSLQSWLAAWSAILLRDVPLGGLQVACYRECHDWVHELTSMLSTAPDVLSDVLAGMLAGAVAAAITTPLDVIVTHMATSHADSKPGYGALQVGAELVREQGLITLTRGMGLRVLYFAPLVGCFFGLYEYFRSLPLL